MNEKRPGQQETPNEIPTRKNPDKTDPIKDPNLEPDKNNPRNPKNDEVGS